jgi:hypothetical protein
MPDAEKVSYSGSHRRQGNTTLWGSFTQARWDTSGCPKVGLQPPFDPPFLGEDKTTLGTPQTLAASCCISPSCHSRASGNPGVGRTGRSEIRRHSLLSSTSVPLCQIGIPGSSRGCGNPCRSSEGHALSWPRNCDAFRQSDSTW